MGDVGGEDSNVTTFCGVRTLLSYMDVHGTVMASYNFANTAKENAPYLIFIWT